MNNRLRPLPQRIGKRQNDRPRHSHWIWWVNGSAELSANKRQILSSGHADGLGVSVISCWEIAKLVEKGRLGLAVPVGQWIDQALAYPGIRLLPLDILADLTAERDPWWQTTARDGQKDMRRLAATRVLGLGHDD
jgi:hypothetical protein